VTRRIPEPPRIDGPHGNGIYIYRTAALYPVQGRIIGFLTGRYEAFDSPYPSGTRIASGLTPAATIRRARRRIRQQWKAMQPVDVSRWT
jgi:hypothetical protein